MFGSKPARDHDTPGATALTAALWRRLAEASSAGLGCNRLAAANVGSPVEVAACDLASSGLRITRPTECCRPIVTSGYFERELDPALNAVGHVADVHRTA